MIVKKRKKFQRREKIAQERKDGKFKLFNFMAVQEEIFGS